MSDNAGPPQIQQGNEPFLIDPANKLTYTIRVDNAQPSPIEVFFFKSPAKFSDVDGTFVNSLSSKVIQARGTQQRVLPMKRHILLLLLIVMGINPAILRQTVCLCNP